MEGWIATITLWYAALTLASAQFATWYDKSLSKRERELVPTSFLVVIGVGGTEFVRFMRLVPVASFVSSVTGHEWWHGLLLLAGFWMLDCLAAYAATGLPMIFGDLRRASDKRDDTNVVAEVALGEIASWMRK
jgi:hypothetical protein